MNKFLNLSAILFLCSSSLFAADQWGLKRGNPSIKSASKLAFGPDDILFVGDTKAGAVVAIATGDTEGVPSKSNINIIDVASKIGDVVGGKATINDIVTNPTTGNVYVAVSAGDKAAVVQINGAGKISQLAMQDVLHSTAQLADIPEDKVTGQGRRRRNNRNDAITDLAFYEGKVLVSGLKTRGTPSSVREVGFPFTESDKGVGVQIFHAAHGREEDYSAMRTFVPLMIDSEPSLLAAYVCTPLVKIPLNELHAAGEKVKATTVAELGNRNRPLDMFSYTKDGKEFLLLSNSARGVMKITTAGLNSNKGLTERVSGGGVAGQSYETVDSLQGVVQMDKLNDGHAIVLIEDDGKFDLKTVDLP